LDPEQATYLNAEVVEWETLEHNLFYIMFLKHHVQYKKIKIKNHFARLSIAKKKILLVTENI
jgi:hypothetical protein